MCFEHILISQPVSTSKQPYVGLVAVQSVSHVQLFATPWTAAHQASLSFTISYSLLRLMSIKSAMPSSHLISVVPFSSCLQSFPASGSFPRSLLFTSGSQSTGASGLASVLPMNIQGWFPLGLTGLIRCTYAGIFFFFFLKKGCIKLVGPGLPSPFASACLRFVFVLFNPLVFFDSLQPHGLKLARLLCPWNLPGKNTGVGCHFLLQGIFQTQGLNPCLLSLLYWQEGSLPLSHHRNPCFRFKEPHLQGCQDLVGGKRKWVCISFHHR